jgi:3-oxoacyl-[acyl-carrier protein] reductase
MGINTNDEDRDWVEVLGLNTLPKHTIGMRLTEILDLTGKKAIVTGAGGDGLGQAVANRLAGLGADVALIGRTYAKVERRAKEIEERWGVKAYPVLADLSDWDQVHNAVTESKEKMGGLDIMINNPVMVIGGPFANHSKDDIDHTVQGSFTMLMYGAHAALEHMLPQGSGTIINTSAVAGRVAQRDLTVYAACKAGVIGFTRNLASEVESQGVRVHGVAPGIMIKPDLEQRLLNPQSESDLVARHAIGYSIDTHLQIKRAGLPEEVANMVAYLASPAASYMCGQTIDVAGGQYMN